MNLNDLPVFEPNINELKKELTDFCEQYSITKFDPDDIVELLEDEEVSWIVGQLQQDNAELDSEKLTSLLTSIQSIVASPKEEEDEEPIPEIEEDVDGEQAVPPMDLSQIDFSKMGPELEALTGMKIPAGVDLNQVKKLMDSPQGEFLNDFSAWCQEQGIDMTTMTDPGQIQELNEQWMSTPRPAFDGKTPTEMSEANPSLMSMKKVETYRREQPRIGRNDPCPCGSGKKYKKCCGRGK